MERGCHFREEQWILGTAQEIVAIRNVTISLHFVICLLRNTASCLRDITVAMNRPTHSLAPFDRLSGYTLIEIMLVLAIISVLVGAGIYFLSGNLDIAKEQRAASDLQTITTQLKTYEMQNQFLPSSEQGLMALVKQPTTEPLPTRWRALMEHLPTDPWGSPYQYRQPAQKSSKQFDLFSLGPDRTESKDDIGNWNG